MNELTVPLASITADGVRIEAEVDLARLQPPDAEGVPVRTVSVAGVLTEAGQEYVFAGAVAGKFTDVCDRCLEPVALPFRVEVVWSFKLMAAAGADGVAAEEEAADVAAGELGVCLFTGHAIDLGPEVWAEVVLAVPSKFLCREDCAGLCPRCGVNWNREQCGCRDKDRLENAGLAGLVDRFPALRPKRSQE